MISSNKTFCHLERNRDCGEFHPSHFTYLRLLCSGARWKMMCKLLAMNIPSVGVVQCAGGASLVIWDRDRDRGVQLPCCSERCSNQALQTHSDPLSVSTPAGAGQASGELFIAFRKLALDFSSIHLQYLHLCRISAGPDHEE